MPDLVILTEAGGSVGYGHLTRCRTIADVAGGELRVQGYGTYPGDSSIRAQAWLDHPEALTRELPPTCLVLVDSYLATREVYSFLARYFYRVVAIDDYDRLNYPVNLLINPGLKLPPYRGQTATVIGGSKYVILQAAIRRQAPKVNYSCMENVLVTFGGSDNRDMFARLVPLLASRGLAITVVVGNDTKRDNLAKAHPHVSCTWLGQVDTWDMARLMANSDLVLSAGGQTLHELAFLGIPTIGVCAGKDQKFNVEGYVEAGFLPAYLDVNDPDMESRVLEFVEMYRDSAHQSNAGLIGRKIIDGRGVLRIAELLKNES